MKAFITVLQVIAALGLIATVLLQSGKSAGISGAIAGGAEQLFGKKKGLDDLLSRISAIAAIAFLLLSLL
ncbi:MAG: preprotein translocase subunit SecG, partial [Clostridia bacterium]|nr:preprotein translocase subunit SecG [Clostridia bacterium]